jgi:hypothetical protein
MIVGGYWNNRKNRKFKGNNQMPMDIEIREESVTARHQRNKNTPELVGLKVLVWISDRSALDFPRGTSPW